MSRKIIRYSDCFKQSVVSEVEKNGLTIQQARDRFGIKGTNTIQLWLKKYGRNHLLNKGKHSVNHVPQVSFSTLSLQQKRYVESEIF